MVANRLTVKEAAELLQVQPSLIRALIRQGNYRWGKAVQVKGKKLTYYINKEQFVEDMLPKTSQ